MVHRCADCGRRVERVGRGRAARWVSYSNNVRSYSCRVILEGGALKRADYHYVEGETQRHFPTVLDTVTNK